MKGVMVGMSIFLIGLLIFLSVVNIEDEGIKYVDATTSNGLGVILFCVDYDKIDEAVAITGSKAVRTMDDVEALVRLLLPYGVEQINYPKMFIEIILEYEGDML